MGCGATEAPAPGPPPLACTPPNGPLHAVHLGVGEEHVCVLLSDGTARCWGSDLLGQISPGAAPLSAPVTVEGLRCADTLAVGAFFNCVRLANQTMACWGDSSVGQLGRGESPAQPGTPLVVPGMYPVSIAGAGGATAAAMLTSGQVWIWGEAASLDERVASPKQVLGLDGVVALVLDSGGANCAGRADGTVWCWGVNTLGQLGDGTTTKRSDPRAVVGITDSEGIVGHSAVFCSINAKGSAKCWGSNESAQLGDGTMTDRHLPVDLLISLPLRNVAIGATHACAATTTGKAYCWGDPWHGALGDPTASGLKPAEVPGLSDVIEVGAGAFFSCALLSDDRVFCWGWNSSQQLGPGLPPTGSPTPIEVDYLPK